MTNHKRWLASDSQAKPAREIVWRPSALIRRRKIRKLVNFAAALSCYSPSDGKSVGFFHEGR